MRIERRKAAAGPSWSMTEMKPEPLDYVEDFQDYLNPQSQNDHVLPGSVDAQKDGEDMQTGVSEEEHVTKDQLASIEVCLDDEALPNGFQKLDDGRMKCRYCDYTNRSTTRLIEHVRIHTGEKPHRCQLCPFSSAYLRHLEAHLRSHAGEKPYKCGLCSFRCNDRSNLSRHRRRHHKHRPSRASESQLCADQDKSAALSHGHILNEIMPRFPTNQNKDYTNGFLPKSPLPLENPPSQEASASSCREEALTHTSTHLILSPGPPTSDSVHVAPQTLLFCPHCQTYFADNVLYTVHMGCHGYDQPFQCNVCGLHCTDKYDFACHFARGQHRK